MVTRVLVFVAAIAIVLGARSECWAQTQTAGSRSMLGTSGTIGQGISSGSSAGRMGASSSSGLSSGTVQLGNTAQQLIQRGNQAGNFVGGNTANTMSAAYGNTSTTGRNAYGTSAYGQGAYGQGAYRQGAYGQGAYGARNRNQTRSAYGMNALGSQPEVRTRLVMGFEPPVVNPAQVSSRLTERLEKTSRIQFRSSPQVSVQDGTAILRGTVATEHDRVLAEQLVRLEAGISRVKNELTLPSAQQPPATQPPASATPVPQQPSSAASPAAANSPAARPPLVPPSASGAK